MTLFQNKNERTGLTELTGAGQWNEKLNDSPLG